MARKMTKAEIKTRVEEFLSFIQGVDPENVHNKVEARFLEGGYKGDTLWVDYSFRPSRQNRNVYHLVHGGVGATLLDDGIGITLAVAVGQDYVTTVNMSVNYLYGMRSESFRMHTEATKVGKTLVSGVGYIYDEEGRLCVTAMATYAVRRPPEDGRL